MTQTTATGIDHDITNDPAAEQRRRYDYFLKRVAQHLSRYAMQGYCGRPAPINRTMECAFENGRELSDALAAALMNRAENNPTLSKGLALTFGNSLGGPTWIRSYARHKGRTNREIRASLTAPCAD